MRVTISLYVAVTWIHFNYFFIMTCGVEGVFIQFRSFFLQRSYLITPWSRVLEKLTGSQLVKKFPAFYRTWTFITTFTSARYLSLSWASSIQSLPHFLKIHINIILPSTPGSPKCSLSIKFHHQNPVYASPLPRTRYMPRPSHSRFHHPQNVGWGIQIIELLVT